MARAGALGHREGPHQDEREERDQGPRARGRRVVALQVGRGPDRLEERAQGRRLLPRRRPARGRSASAARSVAMAAGLLVDARRSRRCRCRASWARRRRKSEVQPAASRRTAASTSSRRRASSSSARATSGSSSACRSSCPRSSAGASPRSAAFLAAWVIGYGVDPVDRAGPHRPVDRRPRAAGPRRRRCSPFVLALVIGARRAVGPARRAPPDVVHPRRARALRRRLRDQLVRPLVPDPRLLRRRQGRDERRLLLHGERRRPARRDAALGPHVPGSRAWTAASWPRRSLRRLPAPCRSGCRTARPAARSPRCRLREAPIDRPAFAVRAHRAVEG